MDHIQSGYTNPVQIFMPPDGLTDISTYLDPVKSYLYITSKSFMNREVTHTILNQLNQHQTIIYSDIPSNPELTLLEELKKQYSERSIDAIIAVGGGSVIDAAKVLSVTIGTDPNVSLKQFLLENNSAKLKRKVPVVAIPTTSGTGAEVTPFATIWDTPNRKKYSLSGPQVFPDYALLLPELTKTLPERITLFTALDSISHALESLWNINKTFYSEHFATESLSLSMESLPVILTDPMNGEGRKKLQIASTLAGLAISHTRTAICHSISYPLTTHYQVPHGLACSFTLVAMIDHYLSSTMSNHEVIMRQIQSLLQSLNLDKRINEYLNLKQAMALANEMYTPERAKNFSCQFLNDHLIRVLGRSFQGAGQN